jgi:hypothetical protein
LITSLVFWINAAGLILNVDFDIIAFWSSSQLYFAVDIFDDDEDDDVGNLFVNKFTE